MIHRILNVNFSTCYIYTGFHPRLLLHRWWAESVVTCRRSGRWRCGSRHRRRGWAWRTGAWWCMGLEKQRRRRDWLPSRTSSRVTATGKQWLGSSDWHYWWPHHTLRLQRAYISSSTAPPELVHSVHLPYRSYENSSEYMSIYFDSLDLSNHWFQVSSVGLSLVSPWVKLIYESFTGFLKIAR